MIDLSSEQLKKLQNTELEMLIEVDRICRKHNIKYSLDGGTLLGAIRHDGFIPWDDDADVVMLRTEYEKFSKVCRRELDKGKFFLQDFRTDKKYRWGYSKLRRKDSVFLRSGQEHGKWNQGIFIDIFVYDQVPDIQALRKLHLFFCFFIRKALYSEVGRKNESNMIKRIYYKLIYHVPRNFWVVLLEGIAKKTNIKRHELVRHMTYPYRTECKYGLPGECFDSYIEKEFEGYKFRIFKKYDLYLTRLYGDYMTPPPIEKRKIHPVSKIKFPDEKG